MNGCWQCRTETSAQTSTRSHEWHCPPELEIESRQMKSSHSVRLKWVVSKLARVQDWPSFWAWKVPQHGLCNRTHSSTICLGPCAPEHSPWFARICQRRNCWLVFSGLHLRNSTSCDRINEFCVHLAHKWVHSWRWYLCIPDTCGPYGWPFLA